MEIRDLYAEELEREFGAVKEFDAESDEYRKVAGDITRYTDQYVKLREIDIKEEELKNEREKIDAEKSKVEIEKQKFELEKQKTADDRMLKIIGYAIEVLGITLTTVSTIVTLGWTFRFEETGSVVSKAGNKSIDRAIRK